jgi:hypothetical protein
MVAVYSPVADTCRVCLLLDWSELRTRVKNGVRLKVMESRRLTGIKLLEKGGE